MDMCSKHGHDQGVLTFSHCRHLRHFHPRIPVILVIFLHSRPLALSSSQILLFSHCRPLALSSSRILAFSEHSLGFSDSRILVLPHFRSSRRFVAEFSRIAILSHCRPLGFSDFRSILSDSRISSARILVLPHSHPLVVLLHGCSVATFCRASALPFLTSSCRSVVLSFSGIVVLSHFRSLCRSVAAVFSCIVVPRVALLHWCHSCSRHGDTSPYQLHIQPSPTLQQVFPIHSCFNSRSLSVGYCCLLVATVTTASVSLACFCHIITDGGIQLCTVFSLRYPPNPLVIINMVVWSMG
jgi:hypothetical protein